MSDLMPASQQALINQNEDLKRKRRLLMIKEKKAQILALKQRKDDIISLEADRIQLQIDTHQFELETLTKSIDI